MNIGKSLKSLFPLFVGVFIENASEMLKLNNPEKCEECWFADDELATEKSILLVESIIQTLLAAFAHDTKKFLTKEYFNLLMQPLVDQVLLYFSCFPFLILNLVLYCYK